MQAYGGFINELVVLLIFIYLSLIVSGKLRLGDKSQKKLNTLMDSRGTLLKVVAYGGVLLFSVRIVSQMLL